MIDLEWKLYVQNHDLGKGPSKVVERALNEKLPDSVPDISSGKGFKRQVLWKTLAWGLEDQIEQATKRTSSQSRTIRWICLRQLGMFVWCWEQEVQEGCLLWSWNVYVLARRNPAGCCLGLKCWRGKRGRYAFWQFHGSFGERYGDVWGCPSWYACSRKAMSDVQHYMH